MCTDIMLVGTFKSCFEVYLAFNAIFTDFLKVYGAPEMPKTPSAEPCNKITNPIYLRERPSALLRVEFLTSEHSPKLRSMIAHDMTGKVVQTLDTFVPLGELPCGNCGVYRRTKL